MFKWNKDDGVARDHDVNKDGLKHTDATHGDYAVNSPFAP